MEKENKNLPVLVKKAVEGVDLKVAEMQLRSQRAETALKGLTSITTAEEDTKAEALLVKVRTTYDAIKKVRMDITAPLDEIKGLLMEPEKLITNDKGAENEYSRVKKLRDDWANLQLDNEKKRLAEIKKTQEIETAKVKIKASFEAAFDMGIINAVNIMSQHVQNSFEAITIETVDALAAKLAKGSHLKQETYDSFFKNPEYNPILLTEAMVEEIKLSVKETKTFPMAYEQYEKEAIAELETWSDKIPALRITLTKSKEESDSIIAKAVEAQKKLNEDKVQAATQKAVNNENSQVMGVAFAAQINTQVGATAINGKTVKKAVIDSCNEDFVVTMGELFYAVFSHPKYPGVIKTDAKKVQQFNEDGTPVYVDWLDGMLTFYANNCSQKIPHIIISESISTTQRKK